MAADVEAFGVDPGSVGAERQSGTFPVWPMNWDSMLAFLACETQWRTVASMAGIFMTGIDYTAADVVLRRFRSPDHVFEDLRLMEREALGVFKEVR